MATMHACSKSQQLAAPGCTFRVRHRSTGTPRAHRQPFSEPNVRFRGRLKTNTAYFFLSPIAAGDMEWCTTVVSHPTQSQPSRSSCNA